MYNFPFPNNHTQIPPEWMKTVQEELINAIKSCGIVLDETRDSQLLSAIQFHLNYGNTPRHFTGLQPSDTFIPLGFKFEKSQIVAASFISSETNASFPPHIYQHYVSYSAFSESWTINSCEKVSDLTGHSRDHLSYELSINQNGELLYKHSAGPKYILISHMSFLRRAA